jgi:hypothetical protein
MLSYGGVPLYCPTDDIRRLIDEALDPADVRHFARKSYPGGRLMNLPWLGLQKTDPLRIETLFWPAGASRWAEGFFLATDQELNLITPQVYANGTWNALPLVMADGKRTPLSTKLFMLPPRPIAQALFPTAQPATIPGLWLLTLVDARYRWHEKAAAITCVPGTTTWAQLFANIATALGITLTVDPVNAAYLNPPGNFATQYEDLAVLLEAACISVGQRLVANYDGTYATQNPLTSLAQAKTNLALQGPRLLGGRFRLLPSDINDLTAIAPTKISVVFPDTAGAAPTVKDNTLATLALPEFGAVAGNGDAHAIHSSVIATGSNGAQLTTLATQASTDWYRWQLGLVDERLIGAGLWVPEGLHDLEWSAGENETNCVSLRVFRWSWNDVTTDMLQYGSGGGGGSGETIDHNAVFVGTEPIINFIDGANITITTTDNPANNRVDVTIAASGSVSSTVIVDHNGTLVGTRGTLNFIDGTNSVLTLADNAGSSRIDITVASKVTVDNAGVAVGTRSAVNFIAGTNVTLTVADNPGGDRVDVTIADTTASITVQNLNAPANATANLATLKCDNDLATAGFGRVVTKNNSAGVAQLDWQGFQLYKAGTGYVGPEPDLEFVAGTNVGITIADDTVNKRVRATFTASFTQRNPVVQILTTGGTWTKPANLDYLEQECVAAGAGGGGTKGGTGSTCAVGGGGGAGGYAFTKTPAALLAATVAYTVGTGGLGGLAGNNAGSGGGDTYFGPGGAEFCRATGGSGGGGGPNQTTAPFLTAGGNGGAGSVGDLLGAGEMGGTGLVLGISPAVLTGGIGGGVTPFGSGGAPGLNPGSIGSSANKFGGGGGGAASVGTTDRAGGPGTNGVIILREYYTS